MAEAFCESIICMWVEKTVRNFLVAWLIHAADDKSHVLSTSKNCGREEGDRLDTPLDETAGSILPIFMGLDAETPPSTYRKM